MRLSNAKNQPLTMVSTVVDRTVATFASGLSDLAVEHDRWFVESCGCNVLDE